MSRTARILRNIGIGIVSAIVVIVAALIVVVHTGWFRHYVQQKIVTLAEESTGGKTEIGSFTFGLSPMRAVVTNFVIHGKEAAGSAPFLRIARIELDLRLLAGYKHLIDLRYLGLQQPEANIIVFPDGQTNLPTPAKKSSSGGSPLETVVDLAVGHFDLNHGVLTFNSHKQPLDLHCNNLSAQLWYNLQTQGYQGRLSLAPVYIASGRNTPVGITINLPVVLERDRIRLHDARVTTAASEIVINAAMEHLRTPATTVHVSGSLALADLKNAGNLPISLSSQDPLHKISLDANATVSQQVIQVTRLWIGMGHSELQASGQLKDSRGSGSLHFRTRLDLGELDRLVKTSTRAGGTISVDGTARLDSNNNYRVIGSIDGNNLSVEAGKRVIRNLNVFSAVDLTPHLLELNGLKVTAFGGELDGNLSMADFACYDLKSSLHNFNLQTLATAAGLQLPYDGALSGNIDSRGDLKEPHLKGIAAHAGLAIAPGSHGIPMSGRLSADYSGATGDVRLINSYIALPHTRLSLNGSLASRLNVALITHDVSDLTATQSKAPITLGSGGASFTGAVMGSLTSPRISGHLTANQFQVDGRRFDSLAADVSASKSSAAVRAGSLKRGQMLAQFAASVGLRDWKPAPHEPLSAKASIRNADLADLLVMAGAQSEGYSGSLTADADVNGTIGNPRGSVALQVGNGVIQGRRFDTIQARVTMNDQLVSIPTAYIASGPARVSLSAEFQHPRNSFTRGRAHAHVQSTDVNLAQILTVQQASSDAGVVRVNVDVTGDLGPQAKSGRAQPEFMLTSLNGEASARGLRIDGQAYGDFSLTSRTQGQAIDYSLTSDFAGSDIRVNGNTQLIRGYFTRADLKIARLPVEQVLAAVKRTNIPAKGLLSATAHVEGTIDRPQGNADLDLSHAVLDNEPIDHVRARVAYLEQSVEIPDFEIVSGASNIRLSARYDHPAGNLKSGKIQFNVNSSAINLAGIHTLQAARPGLGGIIKISASGTSTLRSAQPRISIGSLNASLSATGISANKKNLGDLNLTANTTGSQMNFKLTSNLAGSSIQGQGVTQLRDDYPVNAQLTFDHVTWNRIEDLLGSRSGERPAFDALAAGRLTVNGPVMNLQQLRGSFQLSQLQLLSVPASPAAQSAIVIQNSGPLVATLDRSTVRIQQAHLTGAQTDIQAGGTLSLKARILDLKVNANADLAVLQKMNRDITSSGTVMLTTAVRGTTTKPVVNGRLELHSTSLTYASFPNGISNANGTVLFNGATASIRNITADSGGGKISLNGFLGFTDTLRFGVRAGVKKVRVRFQQGISLVTDADLHLTGQTQASGVSGTVTIDQVTYSPKSDFAGMLLRASPPVESRKKPSALLQNMKLDVRVRTSPAMSVQASAAENLQADADIRVTGRPLEPSVLGRVTITEGRLTFLSNTYTVNSGTITFSNPIRIEPVLNMSLETKAKGVDITLAVTGPVDNMKLSYTSDPPLQFQEIVSLLASGKTPTSDPNILANQPSTPPENLQQMGESALVSKALAQPVASQLQRVFGVSQLKIDPTFTSGSELPQARLTLQQQVASNITFTYVTALNDPNTQIIRIEWAFNHDWSATTSRDENGIFSINIFYKKQFR